MKQEELTKILWKKEANDAKKFLDEIEDLDQYFNSLTDIATAMNKINEDYADLYGDEYGYEGADLFNVINVEEFTEYLRNRYPSSCRIFPVTTYYVCID